MRHGCQPKIGPGSVRLGKVIGLCNVPKCALWMWGLLLAVGAVLFWTLGGCGGQHQAPSSQLPPKAVEAVEKEYFPEPQATAKTPPLASPQAVAGPKVSGGLETLGRPEEVPAEKEATSFMPTPEASQNVESGRAQDQTAGIGPEQLTEPPPQPVASETVSPAKPLSSPAKVGSEDSLASSGRKEEESLRLGPPLVDHPERLQLLHPQYLAWIDPVERALVLVGQVCQQDVPLELFACSGRSKAHESVVWVSGARWATGFRGRGRLPSSVRSRVSATKRQRDRHYRSLGRKWGSPGSPGSRLGSGYFGHVSNVRGCGGQPVRRRASSP